MKMPNFLVIGAAKSGTVSLYHYLNQHPSIFMCPINETNFFALENADFERNYQGPLDRFYLDGHCIKDRKVYQDLFNSAHNDQILGESSPLYLYDLNAAERIQDYLPEVKLIAILRHPTDRAYANFRHFRRSGIEPIQEFERALAAEEIRIEQGWGPWPFWHYRRMGFYNQQFARYFERFDPDQIFIETFDAFHKDPAGVMTRIFTFLGLDSGFSPETATRHNIGSAPRFPWVNRLLTTANPAIKFTRRLFPKILRERMRNRILDWNLVTPLLDPALRQSLDEGYAEDLRALGKIIGQEFWPRRG
jgi:hypothetical protein